MQKTASRVRRLLFVFSDTGGGHRSTACAVAQTLREHYGARAKIELVDALAEYAPWPLNHPSSVYPHMLRLKGLVWAAGFFLSDGPRRVKLPAAVWRLLTGLAMRRLLRDHPADLVISCHAAFNHLLIQLLPTTGVETRLVTLVTDLTAAHAFWFAPGVARCFVPTESTRHRAVIRGVPPERVQATGLPVRACFAEAAREDKRAVQQRLGLESNLPVLLLASGAEGMGPLRRVCRAITSDGVRAQLVVVAGRNDRLREQLAKEDWALPVRVEGFVDNMHEWMRAADLLVTKAGPTTISEASIMGLPMVLSGALPGHERPNVDYVVQAGAGVWAPTPRQVVRAVRELLPPASPALARMAARARSLAQPEAAQRVAQALWTVANGELA
jgi:1,2-diacylglycerol 3-beta-galactosyltransferase